MPVKAPSRTEILDLVQAQSETFQDISQRLVKIEELVNKQESRNDKQESRNQGAFYAVIVGFVIIVVTVAIEMILSTKYESSTYAQINQEIKDVSEKNSSLQSQLDILRAKNPYLK